MKVKTNNIERRGGARPNTGRKPVTDKKIGIYAWVPKSVVDAVGGPVEAKNIAETAILKKAKNILK